MVVFVDLDEDDVSDADPHADPIGSAGYEGALRHRVSKPQDVTVNGEGAFREGTGRINPNLNSISAALGCYPYSQD